MMIDLPHVQKRGANYRYRRKVKPELRAAIGKTEIIFGLGKQDADFVKRYQMAHKAAEELFKEAARPSRIEALGEPTAIELGRRADRLVRDFGLDPDWAGADDPDDFDQEGLAREVIAEGIASKYAVDEHGNPVGISRDDAAVLRALAYGSRLERIEPTLEDAKRHYLKEKIAGTPDEHRNTLRVNRVVGYIQAALGRKNPPLVSLTKIDALAVRDYIRGVVNSPSTVKRYLNDLRAIVNEAIDTFGLSTRMANPFNRITVKLDGVAKNARDPFTPDELARTRKRILLSAGAELKRIWRILEGTGCRLAEVSGLLVSDVVLDHERPYLDIQFHPHRRLKTKGSVRRVPLLGDALEAARQAVEAAEAGAFLFPTYASKKGTGAASAALMKHVRAEVSRRKVTVHSLRHIMKDRLVLAAVAKAEQDLVLGHSSGSVGEAYGGDEARLEVAERALRKAIGL